MIRNAMMAAGMAGLASCTALHPSTKTPEFQKKLGDFAYSEVEAVKQTAQKSCGPACLSCVLKYWEKPVSEPDLVAKYPAIGELGWSLAQLQRMAQAEGLLAFAVAMNKGGRGVEAEVSSHLAKGRPVIAALYVPQGRYFGRALPVIETLDRRSFHPFGAGEMWKHHYVVICGEKDGEYLVMDPAYGGIAPVQKGQLLNFWAGEKYAALLCSPMPAAVVVPTPAAEGAAPAAVHSGMLP